MNEWWYWPVQVWGGGEGGHADAPSAQPNDAHHALAWLEAAHGGSVLVIAQSADDLHEQAGTRNVIHAHDELGGERIADSLARCDVFVEIGTDEAGHPASGLADTARAHGAHTVLLHTGQHPRAESFDWVVAGEPGEIVPDWVEAFLADKT